jgi:hypothetical protein
MTATRLVSWIVPRMPGWFGSARPNITTGGLGGTARPTQSFFPAVVKTARNVGVVMEYRLGDDGLRGRVQYPIATGMHPCLARAATLRVGHRRRHAPSHFDPKSRRLKRLCHDVGGVWSAFLLVVAAERGKPCLGVDGKSHAPAARRRGLTRAARAALGPPICARAGRGAAIVHAGADRGGRVSAPVERRGRPEAATAGPLRR